MLIFSYYFAFFAAASVYIPFLVLYYQQQGFTGAQIGLLTGLTPLIALVGGPFLSGIADVTRRHRLILNIALLSAALLALVYPFLRSFVAVFGLVSLLTFITSPIIPLSDSAVMHMLSGQRERYGRLRLGGTFGWGIMAFAAGMIIDRYGQNWSFWLYAALMFATLLVAQQLRFGDAVSGERVSVWKGVGVLLRDPRWISFLALTLFAGMGMATINTYLFLYFQQMGASQTLMGLSMTVSVISEIPILFFSEKLVRRFSAHHLLMAGIGAIAVRILLGAFINFPEGVLAVQLLHGLTFPVIFVAGVTYVAENAPEGIKATAQSLFGSMLMSLGAAGGGFLGGLLIDAVGIRNMYFVFGAGLLLALALFSILERKTTPPPVA